MKKKCIIIIAVVCVAVVAVAGQFSLDETDRSKKLEKLSDFIKNKPSTNDEIAVEVLKTA